MHENRKWRLLSYDIRNSKRWRAAYKLIRGFGDRLQYSVFRCRLDDRQVAQLRSELAKILAAEDDLLLINLCPGCAAQVVTTQAAKEAWDRPPPRFVVVRRPGQEGRS